MGDLQRTVHHRDGEEGRLRREVRPPGQRPGRHPGATVGLLAAAMAMAASIDGALWHQDLARRQVEQRAAYAEARVNSLVRQNDTLREQLAAAQRHTRALHDELLQREVDEPGPRVRVCAVQEGSR
jgi:hypothetical protein